MAEFLEIPIENLLLSVDNPRYERQSNQIAAIKKLVGDQDEKLIRLAEDIAAYGMDPSQNLLVVKDGDQYIVLEGNRRLAALKLISDSSLIKAANLNEKLTHALLQIQKSYAGSLPSQVFCSVLNREEAQHWILLRHTGENAGIGIVEWNALQVARYKGASPLLQAIDLVKESNFIDADVKDKLENFPVTNFSRLINTREVRTALGIDFQNEELVIVADKEEVVGRLSIVLADIVEQKINVNDIRTKEQRVAYANEILTRPLPKPTKGSSRKAKQKTEKKRKASSAANRKNLIPNAFAPNIGLVRIAKILKELKSIDLMKFVNSAAVTLRVFLELSLDEFASKKKIPLRKPGKRQSKTLDKAMTLSEKMVTVAKYLEDKGQANASELQGIRTLAGKTHHILSIDSLHAFVHNKDFNPTADDLKVMWDNMQTFVERISV